MKKKSEIKNFNKKNSAQIWSDDFIMSEVRALRVGYGLKNTLRYYTKRDFSVHSESVAEHVFALHYLSLYFIPLEDPHSKLDTKKIHQLITFHDFGEILHGDVPYHLKTKEHKKQERKDAKIIFLSLPISLQKIAKESWKDYEEQKTPEAKFVYALDKVEPLFELFNPVNELSLKRLKHSYDSHYQRKFLATVNFPVMRRFTDVVSKDMLARKLFWDNN